MPSIDELERHRPAITGHCYRMLGSFADAEDAVQETMVRAWRAIGSFDGRSALGTWLHRIATNACLDALGDRARRIRAFDEYPVGSVEAHLETRPRTDWIEPIPDARVIPSDADPAEQAILRERVRLAFVAALQFLPPKQRAALLLADVVELSAAEIAQTLDTSVASVNSALQRARATLATRPIEPAPTVDDDVRPLLDRYVDAFERYDADALTTLLHDDAILSMPPYTLWLQGPASIRAWFVGPGHGCRGSRLFPTRASGLPAFAQYRFSPERGYHPWAIIVLEPSRGRLSRMTSFLDVETLFPAFGFALTLRE